MKWTIEKEALGSRSGQRFSFLIGDDALTFGQALGAMVADAEFAGLLSEVLASVPYPAYRWECPVVAEDMEERAFEFVVLDDPGLERPADRRAFARHFASARGDVVTFENLGRDAVMVVPCPLSEDSAYVHLARFMRDAPDGQKRALWSGVGCAVQDRVRRRPVWLSTAGGGVAWLHVRIDDRPKYYGHAEYRNARSG